jgi:hypothetical protein
MVEVLLSLASESAELERFFSDLVLKWELKPELSSDYLLNYLWATAHRNST